MIKIQIKKQSKEEAEKIDKIRFIHNISLKLIYKVYQLVKIHNLFRFVIMFPLKAVGFKTTCNYFLQSTLANCVTCRGLQKS